MIVIEWLMSYLIFLVIVFEINSGCVVWINENVDSFGLILNVVLGVVLKMFEG